MNVPKPLTISASITAGVISLSLLISHVRDRSANTITFDGTPEQVEAAIRAQFPDSRVQDAAIASMHRRLGEVVRPYGDAAIVLQVRGDFYLAPGEGNSLFPDGSDGSQRATVGVVDNNGGISIVDDSVSLSVPQTVSDNTHYRPRVAQQ